jgi:IclR family transcriptional regulator, acetate operon repressor
MDGIDSRHARRGKRFQRVVTGGRVGERRLEGARASMQKCAPLGISAAAIARRAVGDNVIAISVPAPTERFRDKEQHIIAALRAAADSPAWTR